MKRVSGAGGCTPHVLGRRGEKLAAHYLKTKRYKIRCTNYTCPVGEIDIICEKDGCLVFLEIKSRRSVAFGSPKAAVTEKKQRRIVRAASWFLRNLPPSSSPPSIRFDVVSIDFSDSYPILEHIRHAFSNVE